MSDCGVNTERKHQLKRVKTVISSRALNDRIRREKERRDVAGEVTWGVVGRMTQQTA